MKTLKEIKARHKEITNFLSDKRYGDYPSLITERKVLEWVTQ